MAAHVTVAGARAILPERDGCQEVLAELRQKLAETVGPAPRAVDAAN